MLRPNPLRGLRLSAICYMTLLRATQNNGGTKDEYRCVGKEYSEVS